MLLEKFLVELFSNIAIFIIKTGVVTALGRNLILFLQSGLGREKSWVELSSNPFHIFILQYWVRDLPFAQSQRWKHRLVEELVIPW